MSRHCLADRDTLLEGLDEIVDLHHVLCNSTPVLVASNHGLCAGLSHCLPGFCAWQARLHASNETEDHAEHAWALLSIVHLQLIEKKGRSD